MKNPGGRGRLTIKLLKNLSSSSLSLLSTYAARRAADCMLSLKASSIISTVLNTYLSRANISLGV